MNIINMKFGGKSREEYPKEGIPECCAPIRKKKQKENIFVKEC